MIFSAFLNKNKERLLAHRRNRVFFVAGFPEGGLIQDDSLNEYNCGLFKNEELEILTILICSNFFENYEYPVLIDALKAVALYRNGDTVFPDREKISLLNSRITFMGTDGMRGKVYLDHGENSISAFLRHNRITPELIGLVARSFGRMLLNSGTIYKGEPVCVCNDGRDITTGWKLKDAMVEGFHAAGQNVIDLGIGPTPALPFRMLKEGIRAGAVLTASHNPSNQNGIKFFIDGRKLLPEGSLGDYTLAAWIYDTFLGCEAEAGGETITLQENDDFLDFMLSVLPDGMESLLEDSFLILDNANGAFEYLSHRVLERLNLNYSSVNEKPTGSNINKFCGVAEIEGHEEFSASEDDSSIRIIDRMFRYGRSRSGDVFGLVLDGDGDRGFILYYDRMKDRIMVIDGDRSGYILARYFMKYGGPLRSKGTFLVTVESDIMVSFSASRILGLNTEIVSVGDKWICNYDRELFLGLESSGHLVFPLPLITGSGGKVFMRAGNGLLTSLFTLAAVKTLGLSGEEIFKPYEPGYSKTYYTYFVDKTLFYRGSAVWCEDKKIISNAFRQLTESGNIPPESQLLFENKEDDNMLYASISEGESLQAVIFCRNSGTEDKTAVYLKCRNGLEHLLSSLGQSLNRNHLEKLKNRNRFEYNCESIIIEKMNNYIKLGISDIKKMVEAELSRKIDDSDLFGVLYGLRKEGRIDINNNFIKRKKNE